MGWNWENDPVVKGTRAAESWLQDEIISPAPTEQEPPSTLAVAGNAAYKGLAGAGDFILNIAGAAGEGLIPYHLRPQAMRDPLKTGMEAVGLIKPENEPQTPGQRILDMAVQTGVNTALAPAAGIAGLAKNAAVGLTSGALAGVTKEATGSDLAATAVGVATPLLLHSLGGSTANEPTRKNPVKSATLRDAQEAGYVVPPSQVKPSATTNKLEGIAGKAAIRQEAGIRNVEVTTNLAAKAVGLPEGTYFTRDMMDDLANQVAAPYRDVASLSPRAARALESLKQTRFDANEQWRYYGRSGNPEAGRLARSLTARAELYERVIDQEAKRIVEVYGVRQRPVETVQGTIVRPDALPGTTGRPQLGLPPGQTPRAQLETREVGFPAIDVTGNSSKSKAVGFATPSPELSPLLSREVGFAVPSTQRRAPQSSQGHAMGPMPHSQADIEMELLSRSTAGRPTLLQELREARTRIAKIHAVKAAINEGDGTISAPVIARMLKTKPLTGELNLIARFAKAFPSVSREGASIPASGVSGTDAAASAMLATMGYGAAGGPAGLVAGGLPLLRGAARPALLSGMYQKRLLAEPPSLNQALLRSILAGRAVADTAGERQ